MAHQNGVGLPVLSPVAAHAHPPGFGSFDAHPHDIPCTRDVGDQNQVEVAKTVDGESDSSTLSAGYPEYNIKNYHHKDEGRHSRYLW